MFDWLWKRAPVADPKQRMLGPTENALMNLSQRYQGLSRVGEILHLQGPHISLEQLNKAIARLQRRHPALRSRLRVHPTNPDSFLLEEDDSLRLSVEELARKRDEHSSFWLHEWRKREKEPTSIGDALVKIWLLQDPDDKENSNGFREVVIMCEHCVCDGLSLSNAAHELLMILSEEGGNSYNQPLAWAITMEDAIRNSLPAMDRLIMLSRFLFATIYTYLTTKITTARIPFADAAFSMDDMDKHCHTETVYGVLNNESTAKLLARCRQEGVTVTSATVSALLSATASLVPVKDNRETLMTLSLGADTRRRCAPPVPIYDLSYHVSSIAPFALLTSAAPTTSEGSWQLAKSVGQHIKTCVDTGQVLACGMIVSKIYEKLQGPINFAQIPTYGISSWGVLPFVEQYGPWKLAAMTPFVNLIRGPLPFSTIQTVNGVLTVMFGGASPFIASSVLITLRDRCMDTLQQMIDTQKDLDEEGLQRDKK